MAIEHTQGFCKSCNAPRKLERKGTNHILHLLLTLLTLGFWVIVWIGSTIKFGGWLCSVCGSTSVSTSVPRGAGISPDTHVKCPDCRELVLKDARKCKHCGTALIPVD